MQDILWVDKGIKGLASSGGTLSVWFCYLGDKKEEEKETEIYESKLPKIFKNPSIKKESTGSRAEDRKPKNSSSVNKSNFQSNNSVQDERNRDLEEVMNNINFAIGMVNNLD